MPIYRTDKNQIFNADGSIIAEEVVEVDITAEVVEYDIHTKARAAINTNKTFLELASPTNAQTLAQVRSLTRQVNNLIRLEMGRLDESD